MSAKSFADSAIPAHPPPPQRREWRRPLVLALALFAIWAWKLNQWFYDRNAVLHSGPDPFPVYHDWDDVPTSEKLHWVRCSIPGIPDGSGYLCARLTVPMDYQRPLNQSPANPQVHIAMVLLPAPGHGLDTGRFSESPLLVNPGGPGGSGTTFVYPPSGNFLQAAVGGAVDLIGFDPRGIGATVPQADCFVDVKPGSEPSFKDKNLAMMHRQTWNFMAHDIGLPNGTSDALDMLVRRAEAVSKLCLQKDGDEGGFRYMATPNVAADMKSIVDAHDEWLEENGFETIPLGAEVRSPGEAAPPSTKGKLVYWGFSYGTFLGQTFAAMYPDSVGRLILDGVVNSGGYDHPWWISAMRDADPILEKFFYYCHLGKDTCALSRPGDDGPEDVKRRYEKVMADLRAEPLIAVSQWGRMPAVLMEADIKKIVFMALYAPIRLFPLVAIIVNRLYEGADITDMIIAPDLSPMCSTDLKLLIYPEESQAAIGCSDKRYKLNETLDEIFDKVMGYSSFGDVLMSLMISCEGWGIEAQFPSPDWDANLGSPENPVNTSFPILFAGNTHDPVTSLVNAVEMSRNFVGASVFELEAEGHCTLASASLCALTKIRDYLNKGVVPPQPTPDADGNLSGWDKCKSNEQPFKRFRGQNDGAMRAEDAHVLQGLINVHALIVEPLAPPTKLSVGY